MNVIDRLRKAEKSPAWDRISVYAIYKVGGSGVSGKILVKHSKDGAGPLEVFLWDWSDFKGRVPDIQYGRASGYGYDKLAAALSGLQFSGVTLQDHPKGWKESLKDAGYEYQQLI